MSGAEAIASGPRPTLLGVEQSLSGRRWCARTSNDNLVRALVQRLGCSDTLARVLAARGASLDGAERLIDLTLRSWLPDPSTITDMDKLATRLAAAIQKGETIAIFGDYDVDGATSTALLTRYFRACGVEPVRYIPDRLKEGYGPNAAAMDKLADQGVELVITVDCGTLAYAPLQHAHERGLEVLVIDHHIAEPKLPVAHAVVNPNRIDDSSGLGHLAAVGVCFMALVATNRSLRQAGFFDGKDEPNLLGLLDIVALGTVCDVVPLHGLNRAFVQQGLAIMNRRQNAGLVALADVARVDEALGTYHLGFVLGPRVNAGGRVGEAPLGTELLICDDPIAATPMADKLDLFNKERQAIEKAVQEQALELATQDRTGNRADAPLVMVTGKGWHPGVIGIVASRIKEKFGRPTIICAQDEDGVVKGSGRSIPGVDLGRAVTAALEAGLLVNGGGHAMAAGLTATPDQLGPLQEFLESRLADQVRSSLASNEMGIDAVISAGAATRDLIDDLAQGGPYGSANPEPRVALCDMSVVHAKAIGADKTHLQLVFSGADGGRVKAIAFGLAESETGQLLLAKRGRFHVAGHLRLNHFRGQTSVQLSVDDVASA